MSLSLPCRNSFLFIFIVTNTVRMSDSRKHCKYNNGHERKSERARVYTQKSSIKEIHSIYIYDSHHIYQTSFFFLVTKKFSLSRSTDIQYRFWIASKDHRVWYFLFWIGASRFFFLFLSFSRSLALHHICLFYLPFYIRHECHSRNSVYVLFFSFSLSLSCCWWFFIGL